MDIFKLFGKIVIDHEQASSDLEKIGEKASNIAGKIGDVAKVVGTATIAAVGAASAAVASLTKNAIEGYADYEQLVGGVETLFNKTSLSLEDYAASLGKTTDEVFGEWMDKTSGARFVMNNAEKAFKTAGMSANQYMETVTGFSASLISSLEGDTVAAAEVADIAITDMADNANKMGSSMEAIQNAYQGFAKQNYTMLDNLKLGYGGTKTEMERLIKDANKVKQANGEMANLTIDSFADVVEAIHIVQEEMGITGATAEEASTTISGSIGSMKAAWSNLVTGIADDNADLEVLIADFIETLVGDENGKGGVINNILPRLEQSLDGVGQLVDRMIPIIIEKVPTIINEWLPKLLQSGISMVQTILDGMLQNSESITDGAVNIITTLAQGITDNLPDILVTGALLIGQLAAGLAEALPDLLGKIPELVDDIFEAFSENSDTFKAIGKSIVSGIMYGIASLWDSLVQRFEGLMKGLSVGIEFTQTGNIGAIDFTLTGGTTGNTNAPSVNDKGNGFQNADGFATGLDYVPYDEFPAYLHRGEAVLTAEDASLWRTANAAQSATQNEQIITLLSALLEATVGGNQEMIQALMADKSFSIGDREFARLVKQYA